MRSSISRESNGLRTKDSRLIAISEKNGDRRGRQASGATRRPDRSNETRARALEPYKRAASEAAREKLRVLERQSAFIAGQRAGST